MDSDFLNRLNRSLEELDLCVAQARMSSDGKSFTRNGEGTGEEDTQLESEIDQLARRFAELKLEEAPVVANLEARLEIAKRRPNFLAMGVSAPSATSPATKAFLASSGMAAAEGSPLCTNFVAYLSEEEFEHLPKHTKGRYTLTALNELVDAFNLALVNKYALMGLPKCCLDATQLHKVTAYKKQETTDTRNLRFLTTGDLTTRGGAFKSARELTSFVLIMRHCGRIREIPGPECILRYVVV